MITSTKRTMSREHAIYTLHAWIILLSIILFVMCYVDITPYLGFLVTGTIIVLATVFIGIKYADDFKDPVFNFLGLILILGCSLVLNYLMTVFKIDYITVLVMVNLMLLCVYFCNTKNKHEIFKSKTMDMSYFFFGCILLIWDIVCYLFLGEISIIQILSDVIVYGVCIRLIDKTLIHADEYRNSAGNIFLAMEKYFKE